MQTKQRFSKLVCPLDWAQWKETEYMFVLWTALRQRRHWEHSTASQSRLIKHSVQHPHHPLTPDATSAVEDAIESRPSLHQPRVHFLWRPGAVIYAQTRGKSLLKVISPAWAAEKFIAALIHISSGQRVQGAGVASRNASKAKANTSISCARRQKLNLY